MNVRTASLFRRSALLCCEVQFSISLFLTCQRASSLTGKNTTGLTKGNVCECESGFLLMRQTFFMDSQKKKNAGDIGPVKRAIYRKLCSVLHIYI